MFMTSVHVFNGVLRKLKADGLDKTKHKTAIDELDFKKCMKLGSFQMTIPFLYRGRCLLSCHLILVGVGERD